MHSHRKFLTKITTRGIAALSCFACINTYATTVEFKVESLNPTDGVWFSPVFFGFHDGSFDSFDVGTHASASIESIAEEGNSAGLVSDIGAVYGSKAHVLLRDDTAMGPPAAIFSPGSYNSFMIDLDTSLNRFLSVASMVVPSNDAFFGNDDPMAYSLFDTYGNFKTDFSISIYGKDVWDAGTEVNDGMGAAFSAMGGTSTSSVSLIAQHEGLDNFVGTELATGMNLGQAFEGHTPIARISARQVPDSTSYITAIGGLALLGFQLVTRRKVKRS